MNSIILASGPPSGVEKPLLQIFVWFAGIVLVISAVSSTLGMMMTMRGSGKGKRIANKMNSARQQYAGGGSAGGGGGGPMPSQLAGGGPGGDGMAPGTPVDGMTGTDAGDIADPGSGSVSMTDDGSVMTDPANSDEKLFIDEDGVNSYSPDDDGLDPAPVGEKASHVAGGITDRVDQATGGRMSEMAGDAKMAGKGLYDELPENVKQAGSLASRAGQAYGSVAKEPGLPDSVARADEIARESPIAASAEPETGPAGEWGAEESPDVHPLSREEFDEKIHADGEWTTDGFQKADYVSSEAGAVQGFEDLPADQQVEALMGQINSVDGFQQLSEYEQAQFAGNMQRFFNQVNDPGMASDMFDGLSVNKSEGLAYHDPAVDEYGIGDVQSYEEFSHEMQHRMMTVNGIDVPWEEGGVGVGANELASDFGDFADSDGYVNFDFENGHVTTPDGEIEQTFEPQDAMFQVNTRGGGMQTAGVTDWDSVAQDLRDQYGVGVSDDVIPDSPGSDTTQLIDGDPDDELVELASEANKAVFKQQMVTQKAMNNESPLGGLKAKRQMREVSIGEDGYAATNAQETLAQTSEILQTTDAQRAAKQVRQLQEHHPDLVEKYREVFDVSDTAAQYLD